jgi:hypothetical protein
MMKVLRSIARTDIKCSVLKRYDVLHVSISVSV